MGGTEAELRTLVARATFLSERLRHGGSERLPPELLDRWRAAVEPAGTDWFAKRLRWDGIDPEAVGEPDPDAPIPPWAELLGEIVAAAGDTIDAPPVDPEAPVPFQELLLPAVAVARTRLGQRHRDLERGLLQQLSGIAGPALQAEFDVFRPFGRSLAVRLDLPEPDAGDVHYLAFVERHLRDGWRSLLGAYPVLGRLIATAVGQWVDAGQELLGRLAADRDALARARLAPANAEFVGFEVGAGDRHRGGRSVTVVQLSDGGRLVYKPKPLASEASFNALLGWCNARGASPRFRITRTLDRGTYGWAEHLGQLPCEDGQAAERFFRRAGMLLCLLHVLQAADCHYENLIAHGEHPVLVDAETILYPTVRPLQPGVAARAGALARSVLATGFLPRWQGGGGHEGAPLHDSSALGGIDPFAASRPSVRWEAVNTDAMVLRLERGFVPSAQNAARVGEATLSPLDHEPTLTDGFAAMYRLLLRERESFLDALAVMRSQPVRFIYRPTRVYSALIAAGHRPELLRGGIEHGLHLEHLARAYLVVGERPAAWPVFAAEVQALERMDIPLFAGRTDSTDLDLDGRGELADAFTAPSHDDVLARVGELGEDDLARQLLVIRAALRAKSARTPSGTGAGRLPAAQPLTPGELVAEATAIGLEIERHALPDGGGGVGWIGLRYLEDAERYQLDVLGDSLYDGCAGVGLFLAALAHVTGDRRFAALALQGLDELRSRLRSTDPGVRRVVARAQGLGGGVGLGSVIYALVRMSGFLEDDGLLADAAALARWLTLESIEDDETLDVLSGSAGALLALLALDAATGDPPVLETAVRAGDHLLRHRVDGAWRTITERPLTGFSHGAAGISYALLRLNAATGRRAYADAARDGIEYERSVYSEAHRNWPDLRPAGAADASGFPVKWCHGAAGIALARLGCRRVSELPGLEDEIAAGLHTTRDCFLQDSDFLCCGNLGRAETLLVGGDEELAAVGVARVVARARRAGGYRLFAAGGSFNPGFFQGTAGIGYQLLRMADPRLPSVLLWE